MPCHYLCEWVNCTLMDYIQRTVTFELRSIIRNCAIKPPRGSPSPTWRITCIYVPATRRGVTRVLRPRISIKTSNFIFKFTGTIVVPIVHVPCHRQARLPSSGGVPCRFSIVLLFFRFSSSFSRRVSRRDLLATCYRVYSSRFPRGKSITRVSIHQPIGEIVLFSRRDQSLFKGSLL